ncbi:MAG TPA: hypothetical protein P5550_06355, partial [Bacteroidales bacterium]|nr:hypothetical protein [Bacteroidales bacterium]
MKTKTTRSRAGMIVTVLLLSFWTAMAAPLPVSSIQPTNNEYTESFTSTTAPTGWSHGQFMTSDNWTYGTPSGAIPSTYGRGWYRNETAKSPSLPLTEWSYVDFPAFDFSNFVFDPVVDLDIFYNTTSGYGMRLAYTTDNINWFPVGGLNDQDVYAENWYNTAVMNFMGGPGWSGNSNGWIDAVHTLTGLAGESYVDFRMYFVGGSNADVVAFDNLHIFESFGVAITSDATQVSDDPGFSIQNGECITLKAEVYGNVPVTSIHWYSMTADQVSVNSWWCDHMYSIGAAMGCFFNAPPYSGNVSSWTCDLVGTGDSINVCPDSSTFYYAVINNGSFMPCQGIATAWPFMPGFWYDPSNFGPLPPKGGPTWVYAGSAVAVIDPLEVEAEYDGFTVCDTATTPLFAFATGGVPPYTYAWSPTTNLAPTNTAVVYSTTNNNIVYTVTVTDALGNTATDDVDISVVSGYPFVDIVPNNVLLCEGQSATLSAYGGSTWNWYVVPSGAATFSATNTVTTEITATGTHASFQVFCDLTSSCGPATAFMTVNVSPTPAAPTFLNAGPYEVCSTDPLIDLAASLQPSPAGGTFSGPGVYNGFFDPSHAASLPFTTYTLYYTIESANGCQAVDSFNVQVWPSSTPFLFTVGPDTVCLNDVTVHVAGFLPGALIQVNWTVDGGNILNVFGPDSTAVQIEWTTVGSGQIRAEYVGAYCTNYDTFDVVVNPLPVFSIKSNEGVVAVSDTFIYCEEDVDSLYADIIPGLGTGFGGYAVDWTIYNGIGTGSPVASYTNVYGLPESPAYNPNAYPTVQYWTVTATLLDSSTGCYAYDTAYVKVFPLPEPEIMAQGPDADTLFICANECGKVYEANDYDSYVWFVDGTKVAETSDTLEVCGADFTAPDTFEIMVIAFSADGCSDTAYIDAVVWVTPTPFALMNDGDLTFCWNTTGPELYLDSSQVGINYQLYRDGATVGAPLAGDGDSITWGNFNIPGDYYVHAVNTVTGCEDWMLDTLTLVSDTIVIDLLSEFSQVCEDFTSRMTVDFTPSDTTGYGPFTFDWDPDAKFTPDGYGTGLALPGDVDTWYYVTVIGTDPLCQATDSFFLTVLQGPEPSIGDSAN